MGGMIVFRDEETLLGSMVGLGSDGEEMMRTSVSIRLESILRLPVKMRSPWR